MQTIRSHNITLYGGYGSMKLMLQPLRDADLPYLYRWNADPEVLYWTEGGEEGETLSYSPEEVRGIYGSVSQDALLFLIKVDGRAVGECWLQPMNLQEICARYPKGTDARRIDIMIGEKDCWNRGIGTRVIAMLTEYAFAGEITDVLHCLCDDYNLRSRRIWEKNGFSLVCGQPLPEGQKGKMQLHYRLTRREYIANRRYHRPEKKSSGFRSAAFPQASYILARESCGFAANGLPPNPWWIWIRSCTNDSKASGLSPTAIPAR